MKWNKSIDTIIDEMHKTDMNKFFEKNIVKFGFDISDVPDDFEDRIIKFPVRKYRIVNRKNKQLATQGHLRFLR